MPKKSSQVALALLGLGGAVACGVVVARPEYWVPAVGTIAALALLALILRRPQTAVLVLVSIPPGVLALGTSAAGITQYVMGAVIVCAFVAVLVRRPIGGNRGLVAGYGLMVTMMIVSYARQVVPNSVGATNSLMLFVYYGAVYLLVLNVAPSGPRERVRFATRLHVAILASVLATGVIALFQVGGAFLTTLNVRLFPEDAGFLYTRTHFGYLMALGVAVALPRWALAQRPRLLWTATLVFSLAFVALSVTRGSWIGTILIAVAVGLYTRRWWLLAIGPMAYLFTLAPGIRQRLAGDLSGGALLAVQSGVAGSHRFLLWGVLTAIALREPVFGHGFGFVSSLSPSLFFGEGQFVTAVNPLIYAHNDALFLVLELGIVGLVAYLAGIGTWVRELASSMSRAKRSPDSTIVAVVLTCMGAAIVLTVAQTVDNGFFIKSLYERCVVTAASLWLVRDSLFSPEGTSDAGSVDQ